MSAGGLPLDPADFRLTIHALADGELDAAATLALERRLADDPALAADYARVTALRSAISRLPVPPVSDDFRERIAALAPQSAPAPMPAPTARRFDWRAMAASILVTAMLASGTTYLLTASGPVDTRSGDTLADAIASSHRRSLLAASPIDIASSDRHTIKPWLDARIGLSPPAVDLAASGYALIGGRVDVIAGRAVPSLVYRHREHLITLVAAPLEPGAVAVPSPVPLAAGGFSMLHWTDGAFSYWAISDADHAALADFAARFRTGAAGG